MNNKIKLTENELRGLIRTSINNVLNEGVGNDLNSAIDMLVDVIEELQGLAQSNKTLSFDLATPINNLKSVWRIVRNNAYDIN